MTYGVASFELQIDQYFKVSANKQQPSIILNIHFKSMTSWEMAGLEINLKCLSELLMTNLTLQYIFSLTVLAGPSEFNNRQSAL